MLKIKWAPYCIIDLSKSEIGQAQVRQVEILYLYSKKCTLYFNLSISGTLVPVLGLRNEKVKKVQVQILVS